MGSISVSTQETVDPFIGGAPSYDELSMFRVMVLQNLCSLSDRQMKEMLYDRLFFRRFCDFGLEATLPDATTILRFRSLLEGQSEKLLSLVNEELSEKGITWTGGSIVDATVIESKSETPPRGEPSPTDPESRVDAKKRSVHFMVTRSTFQRQKKALFEKLRPPQLRSTIASSLVNFLRGAKKRFIQIKLMPQKSIASS